MATDQTIEQTRQMELVLRRREAEMKNAAKRGEAASRTTPKINPAMAIIAMIFFGALDLIDWMIVGMIPGAGDVIDVMGGFALLVWIKTQGLDQGKPWYMSWSPGIATGVELVPGGDIIPSFALAALMIIIANSERGMDFLRLVSPI